MSVPTDCHSATDAIERAANELDEPQLKVLFVLEGFSDIRFVAGLASICELTLLVPARQYRSSGLEERIAESGLKVAVLEVSGGRWRYQFACFRKLWACANRFDVILSQELLRGSLNACIVGKLKRKPIVAIMTLPPLEYFRCLRKRKLIGRLKSLAGEALIRILMAANSRMVTGCATLGPFLADVAARSGAKCCPFQYYGIDTELYSPVSEKEQRSLRERLSLPRDKFLVFLPSRISHEKDPETVIKAVALARKSGLDAAVINLSGDYQAFLALAAGLGIQDCRDWVLARPPAHPMRDLPDYYRAVDCVALASLEEGLGMSPLESLSCGTPAVCTAVGGMAHTLPGYARLVPRRDAVGMAAEIVWVARNPHEARSQALLGRAYVKDEWGRNRAFEQLGQVLKEAGRRTQRRSHAE